MHAREGEDRELSDEYECCDEAGGIRHVHVVTNRATDYMYVGMKHDMGLSRCALRLGRQGGLRVCARLCK
jgi:hypothetical protein